MSDNIGMNISKLRRHRGMTQQELTEKLNVSNKTISRWERQESYPDVILISKIADIFGVSCDDILRGFTHEINEVESTPAENNKRVKKSSYTSVLNIISAALTSFGMFLFSSLYFSLYIIPMEAFKLMTYVITPITAILFVAGCVTAILYFYTGRAQLKKDKSVANTNFYPQLRKIFPIIFAVYLTEIKRNLNEENNISIRKRFKMMKFTYISTIILLLSLGSKFVLDSMSGAFFAEGYVSKNEDEFISILSHENNNFNTQFLE